MARDLALHVLDVGNQAYGDCLLIEAAGRRVLVDGGHPSDLRPPADIPRQLAELTGESPARVDLLVVSHAHNDHVGCLPELVADGVIDVEWALVADPDLGWGRRMGDSFETVAPDAARLAAAGMHEEGRSRAVSDAELEAWLADALAVEPRYRAMIDNLQTRGTRVVRHGRDEPEPLLREFRGLDLAILGPSKDQLALTAEGIRAATAAAIEDAFVVADAAVSAATVYRRLIMIAADGVLADSGRPGDLVNLQSIVFAIRHRERGILLTGDHELARHSSREDRIAREVARLRERIRLNRPYAIVKVPHHGSPNGIDETVLTALGRPRLFAISGGRLGEDHPSPVVLGLLKSRLSTARWVRTDRNGRTTIEFLDGSWRVAPSRGEVNDMTAPEADATEAPSVLRPTRLTEPALQSPTNRAETTVDGDVEVSVRISRPSARVHLTIDVQGSAPEVRDYAGGPTTDAGSPRLLWVTTPDALVTNIGVQEAPEVIADLERRPGRVLRLASGSNSMHIQREIFSAVAEASDPYQGIVLIGGYDIVPPFLMDVIPPTLRPRVQINKDLDRFFVYSDEPYAVERTSSERLPISRVPDARSAALLRACLAARPALPSVPRGLRNHARPYAESVFSAVPSSRIVASEPLTTSSLTDELDGDLVYLMLHGEAADGRAMQGERIGQARVVVEALQAGQVASRRGAVVVSGACWGALTVDPPARALGPGQLLGPRAPEASIALRYLATGAAAFIGTTGSHYSPKGAERIMGRPMHESIFEGLVAGKPPARALRDAKTKYLRELPHGLTNPTEQAFEHKLFWEFTCLGVGW